MSFSILRGGVANIWVARRRRTPQKLVWAHEYKKKCFFGRSNFGELVLEEKLFSRAPLRDSEPSRAANAISDVFLVNRVIKHGTGEESRGREESRGPRRAKFSRWGPALFVKGRFLNNWTTIEGCDVPTRRNALATNDFWGPLIHREPACSRTSAPLRALRVALPRLVRGRGA